MSSPKEEVTTTEVEKFDEFYDKDVEKDREEVLTAWGVKQEEPSLFEKSDTPSSPSKEILNDVETTLMLRIVYKCSNPSSFVPCLQ